MNLLVICFSVLLAAILLALFRKFSYKHGTKKLPGPWCLPLIGYPFLFTKSCHVKLGELADRYGDLFQIYIGGKLVIVLSSMEAAKQAFGKLELSGRPSFESLAVFNNEVKGEFAFTSFSEACIFIRKALIRSLGRLLRSKKSQVETMILAAQDSLKQQLLESEGSITDPDKLIHKTIISIIGPMTLGSELNCKDLMFDQLLNSTENFNKVMKFNFVANYFPLLRQIMHREFKVFRENNSRIGKFMEETIRNHRSNNTVEDLQFFYGMTHLCERFKRPQLTGMNSSHFQWKVEG
ncbi:Cytochrome P450 1A1 [Trichuris trichiura]|uniref:unspecific monooxygenase n=1 Tax=Trichuris trichiura TaxID=36087 RepID=A0A077ZJS9_TRITR|nr:Cytochrome P450 1A1 [Trichuris trichiura]